MKIKVYVITYTSYEENDNYLYSDSKVTTEKIVAMNTYEKWCNSAKCDARGEHREYGIFQGETTLPDNGRKYTIGRLVGTGNGYQAIVKLSITDL